MINMDTYYNISSNIINKSNNKRNYETLQNINVFINSNNIIIKEIINEGVISNKLNKLVNIYNKMNNTTNNIIGGIKINENEHNKEINNIYSFGENKKNMEKEEIRKEVTQMVEQYKKRMMNFIAPYINQYENEDTVNQFLNSLYLPLSLDNALSSSKISDSLWRNISEIQSRGGTMKLNNMMESLQNFSGKIKNRIEQSINSLKKEEAIKQKLNYMLTLEDYKDKLNQAMEYDKRTINDIHKFLKFFDLLSLPRQSLEERIPHCKEADDLKKEINALEAEKNKAKEIISKIFTLLNDDDVANQFIQVIQKKNTENNILAQNKGQYMVLLKELGEISNNIKNLKINVKNKNEIFMKVKKDNVKKDPAKEQYFKDLDNYVQLFETKETQLQQGLNFYNKFEQKLYELNKEIADFLNAREMDKEEEELTKYIS